VPVNWEHSGPVKLPDSKAIAGLAVKLSGAMAEAAPWVAVPIVATAIRAHISHGANTQPVLIVVCMFYTFTTMH
jgi:hypothetical protein